MLCSCTHSQKLTRVVADVSEQKMYTYIGNTLVKTYPISTSKYGVGSRSGSYKTPLGQFDVNGLIGDGMSPHQNFKGRRPVDRPTGIKSRIIVIKDRGGNPQANTLYRYIYIHGSDSVVGRPTSIGCVHLRPYDMVDLYSSVSYNSRIEFRY